MMDYDIVVERCVKERFSLVACSALTAKFKRARTI